MKEAIKIKTLQNYMTVLYDYKQYYIWEKSVAQEKQQP